MPRSEVPSFDVPDDNDDPPETDDEETEVERALREKTEENARLMAELEKAKRAAKSRRRRGAPVQPEATAAPATTAPSGDSFAAHVGKRSPGKASWPLDVEV